MFGVSGGGSYRYEGGEAKVVRDALTLLSLAAHKAPYCSGLCLSGLGIMTSASSLCTDWKEMPWFKAVEEFSDAKKSSESKRDDDVYFLETRADCHLDIRNEIVPIFQHLQRVCWILYGLHRLRTLSSFAMTCLNKKSCPEVNAVKQNRSNKVLISSPSFSDQHCGRQIIATFQIPRQTVVVSCS
ncbi:hypothetical protein CIB84_010206, partial [Bambusicola thoracicus]